FFFFQAEDGIRDGHVTGVQTCALPIYEYIDARRCTHRRVSPAVEMQRTAKYRRCVSDRSVRPSNTGGEALGEGDGEWWEGARGKIGRASCRERVWMAGVGV